MQTTAHLFFSRKARQKAIEVMKKMNRNYMVPEVLNYAYVDMNSEEARTIMTKFYEELTLEAKIALVKEQVSSSSKFKKLVENMFRDDLKKVDLSKAKLIDEHAIVIYQWLTMTKNLTELDLSENRLESFGAMYVIKGLANNTSLVNLNLKYKN